MSMGGMYKGLVAGVAGLMAAGAVQAEPAGHVASDQAPLAAIAEVAALQLCVSWAKDAAAVPAGFQPDLSLDVYDLQPGQFELGRFGRITTATGELRVAVFPHEGVCRVGVGDAPVDAVKAQLLAALGAPDSGWRETAAANENGAWKVEFVSTGPAAGARPVQLAVNGFSSPRDGGRGRQMWVTVGQALVD